MNIRTLRRSRFGILFGGMAALGLVLAGCNRDRQTDTSPKRVVPRFTRPGDSKGELRVLFIGNSRVFMHDLPAVVQTLAASHPDRLSIRPTSVAVPNAKLVEHVSNPQTLAMIKAGDYDWVILQEKSGVAFGDPPRKDFDDSVDKLNAEIRKANPNAQVALYMVHALKGRAPPFQRSAPITRKRRSGSTRKSSPWHMRMKKSGRAIRNSASPIRRGLALYPARLLPDGLYDHRSAL